MFEITRYEGVRRIKGSLILSGAIAGFALLFIFMFPSFEGSDIDDIADSLPPAMVEMFGIEAMGTIEGFIAVRMHNFMWVLFLGIYFAYTAAGIIARDIEDGHLDLLLSYPVSRQRVLLARYSALIVPIVLLNLIVPIVIYGGILIIGESMEIERLIMVHLMSIPFFLACAGVGSILSVIVNRASVSQRIALGTIFLLWLFESIVASIDGFEWLKWLSPTTYYNPTDILVHADYDMRFMAVLIGIAILLMVLSIGIFRSRDI